MKTNFDIQKKQVRSKFYTRLQKAQDFFHTRNDATTSLFHARRAFSAFIFTLLQKDQLVDFKKGRLCKIIKSPSIQLQLLAINMRLPYNSKLTQGLMLSIVGACNKAVHSDSVSNKEANITLQQMNLIQEWMSFK